MSSKRIRIVGHSKELVFPFSQEGPWKDFANEIEKNGYVITTAENDPKVNFLIAHSHSQAAIKEADKNKISKKNRVLVIWEPEVVDERIRSRRVLKHYGHVFLASRLWKVKTRATYFNWPQSVLDHNQVDYESWLNRENHPALIQANKFSIHKDEMYSLRRKVIRSLEKSQYPVALYGPNWNKGLIFNLKSWLSSTRRVKIRNYRIDTFFNHINSYKHYRGIAENKKIVNSQHKCSIVIENSLDYISEKLFDAVSAGSYVFYIGPKVSDFGLNGFLVESIGPNAEEIKKSVQSFLEFEPTIQFKMMLDQKNSLLPYLQMHKNSEVLGNLARECVSKFNN